MADRGTIIREAHYPDRAPIDAYGDGTFKFARMGHRGGLLCLPSGIYAWSAPAPSELTVSGFAAVFEEAEAIEILLVGTGTNLRPIPEDLRTAFREASIMADPMSTGAAVRTYNVLLAEGRAVAAALIPVD
ncbi:MAG: Mth938-like domain-containing protein [Pseudomonadota bacterium]